MKKLTRFEIKVSEIEFTLQNVPSNLAIVPSINCIAFTPVYSSLKFASLNPPPSPIGNRVDLGGGGFKKKFTKS